jgi:hypothetical protein
MRLLIINLLFISDAHHKTRETQIRCELSWGEAICGSTNKGTNRPTDQRTNGPTDQRTNGPMDQRTKGTKRVLEVLCSRLKTGGVEDTPKKTTDVLFLESFFVLYKWGGIHETKL